MERTPTGLGGRTEDCGGTARVRATEVCGRATTSDLDAVHRILNRLPPPLPLPTPLQALPPVSRANPPYRNSLLLVDERTSSILGVIPLSSDPPERPRAPAPYVHPPEPTPTSHTSASGFAAYVEHVVEMIHPNPTDASLAAKKAEEDARRKKLAEEEEEAWAVDGDQTPALIPTIDYAVTLSAPEAKLRRHIEEDDDDEPKTRAERRRLEKGFERLDLEMELACDSKPPSPARRSLASPKSSTPPPASRPVSTWTTSSFATFAGTEQTRSTVARGPPDSWVSTSLPAVEEDDPTPRPTRFSSSSANDKPASPPLPPSASPTPDPLLSTATLTNGNAVLLSFLGAPSSLLPSPSSIGLSSPPRLAVTAHPLSAEDVSERTKNAQIVLAEVDAVELAGGGKGGKDGGWWSWLSAWWRPVEGSSTGGEEETKAGGVLSWFSLSALFDHSVFSSGDPSTASPSATPRRRTPRSAGAETSACLSVYHVDGEGWGRRAYLSK
ncbi:hypothetical protein JCM8547_002946 [Rhodosporidiobolus lusitaniae]